MFVSGWRTPERALNSGNLAWNLNGRAALRRQRELTERLLSRHASDLAPITHGPNLVVIATAPATAQH